MSISSRISLSNVKSEPGIDSAVELEGNSMVNGVDSSQKVSCQSSLGKNGKVILESKCKESLMCPIERNNVNVPCGRKLDDKKASESLKSAGQEHEYLCRFCNKSLICRRSGTRHEKRCRIPGAPGHSCQRDNCSDNCKGTGTYKRPFDRRFGNPLSGRPRTKYLRIS